MEKAKEKPPEFFKSIKTSLKSILKHHDINSPILNDAVIRASKMVIHTLQFLKLYLLDYYEKNHTLPMITLEFINNSMKVICGDKEEMRGKPPSKETIELKEQLTSFYKEQRTSEWYKFRWNLITASNAWKAFESQPAINQLIYEKCQPLKVINNDDEEVKMVNTNTPLHWGQKYEPLTVMLYEREFNTKVEDFGCIQHSLYKFIGASPDGIIVNKDSERYGRMLEIKNVVSRDINGIPKKEYWIQMQLQMEVCDLDECDFLETKFVEYPDEQTFMNDTKINDLKQELCISLDNKTKGIILYFHTKEGKPFYKYKPLEIITANDIKLWEETELEKYESEPYNYTFLKFIYWKLEKLSCVLVLRNKEWFKNNIGQLEKVWKTIEEERISGYEHRAPVKKTKKEPLKPFIEKEQGCLLKFTNIIKVDTNV